MPYQKGSILVCDGEGHVDCLVPVTDGQAIISDSTSPNGVRYGYPTSATFSGLVKFGLTQKYTFTSTNYSAAVTFTFPGSDTTTIQSINILSNMTASTSSYTIRLYDLTNDNIIAQNTFTNTTTQINQLTPLSNLPTTVAVVELQVKLGSSGSGRTVYIREINIR